MRNRKMANQPDINKVQRGQRIDRELDAKVLKKFRLDTKMTVKDAYILALTFATKDVELTPEELEKIAEEKRAAKRLLKIRKGRK